MSSRKEYGAKRAENFEIVYIALLKNIMKKKLFADAGFGFVGLKIRDLL